MITVFNDNEPYVTEWLKNLFPDSTIINKNIIDLTSPEIQNFKRVHLFAGIGGWEYALRLAGWPEDEPVWTGSCPCQPFSVAAKLRAYGNSIVPQIAAVFIKSFMEIKEEERKEYERLSKKFG